MVFATANAQTTGRVAVEEFLHSGLPFFGSRVTQTTIRALPGLQQVRVTKERNNYDPKQTDSMVRFSFADMEVYLLCAPATAEQCSISQVKVWGGSREIKFGLNPGATVQEVERALSAPSSATPNEMRYNGESDQVVFILRHGRVKEVRWNMYTG